ncbi:hypothetical protein AEAC466_04765 [Asticcacaulis sp. AC466]|nr:hypothetical protein AEAC466_04765 [Asticcacaulis sp. AC466]
MDFIHIIFIPFDPLQHRPTGQAGFVYDQIQPNKAPRGKGMHIAYRAAWRP